MTTRPKKKRKTAAKKAARKTRGAKPARLRKKKTAKKASTAAKPAKAGKGAGRSSAARQPASRSLRRPLSITGRRLKSSPPRRIARARVTPRPRGAKPAAALPRVPGVVITSSLAARHAGLLTPAALRFLAELHRAFEAPRQRLLAARAESGEATGQASPQGWHVVEDHVTVDREPISAALLGFGLYTLRNVEAIAGGTAAPFDLPPPATIDDARLWADLFAHVQDRFGVPPIRATIPAGAAQDIREALRDHIAAPGG